MSVNLDGAVYVYLLDFSENGGGQYVGVSKNVKSVISQYFNGWGKSKIAQSISQAVKDYGEPKLSVLHTCKYKFEALRLKEQEMKNRGIVHLYNIPKYELTTADRRKPRTSREHFDYVIYLLKWNVGSYVGKVRRSQAGKVWSFNFSIELLREITVEHGEPDIELLHMCRSFSKASELQQTEIKKLGTLLPNGFNMKGLYCIYLDYYALFNEHFMNKYSEQWETQPYSVKKATIEKEMVKRGWGFAIRLQQKSLERK